MHNLVDSYKKLANKFKKIMLSTIGKYKSNLIHSKKGTKNQIEKIKSLGYIE